jgi:hypothetical protein
MYSVCHAQYTPCVVLYRKCCAVHVHVLHWLIEQSLCYNKNALQVDTELIHVNLLYVILDVTQYVMLCTLQMNRDLQHSSVLVCLYSNSIYSVLLYSTQQFAYVTDNTITTTVFTCNYYLYLNQRTGG